MTFELVGDRGAMEEALENTMTSFRLAEEIGVDFIETDVRLSADGQLFLLHDKDLARVGGESLGELGPVAELAWERIRAAELRDGERVPLLSELYDGTTTSIQLEIKAPEALPALRTFFAARPEAAQRTVLTGFSLDALTRAAELMPDIPRGFIVSSFDDALAVEGGALAALAHVTAFQICTGFPGLSLELVDQMMEAGYITHVWPLRTADDLDRGIALGALGGTANDPRTFRRLLTERGL